MAAARNDIKPNLVGSAFISAALCMTLAGPAAAQARQSTPGTGGGDATQNSDGKNYNCAPGTPGCDLYGPPAPPTTSGPSAFDQSNALQGNKPGTWVQAGSGGSWSYCTDTMCSMPCTEGPNCGPNSGSKDTANDPSQNQNKPAQPKDPTNPPPAQKSGSPGDGQQKTNPDGSVDVPGVTMKNDPGGTGQGGAGGGIQMTSWTPPPTTTESLSGPAFDSGGDNGTVAAGKRAPEVLAALRNVDQGFTTSAPVSVGGASQVSGFLNNVFAMLGLAKQSSQEAAVQAGASRPDGAAAEAGVAFGGAPTSRPELPVREARRGAFGTREVVPDASAN